MECDVNNTEMFGIIWKSKKPEKKKASEENKEGSQVDEENGKLSIEETICDDEIPTGTRSGGP